MALDPAEIVRRLGYIRYLYGIGVEQSRLPDPMSSAALLMFHDSVESFLLMAGEHLGAPSVHEFEKYWNELRPSKLPGGVELPVQQGMKRLNRQRIALKHHESLPNHDTIEVIRSDTGTFLVTASQLVFGVDYSAVSMANIIPQEPVRNLALKADGAVSAGDPVNAMIALVDAWEELLRPWPRTRAVDESSPLQFGPEITRPLEDYEIAAYLYSESGSRRRSRGNEEIGRQIATVTKVVTALQEAARLTAIGLDYTNYQRFRALTPYRVSGMTGVHTYRAPTTYAPNDDDVIFCIHFVVTAALKLADKEAQLVDPAWIDSSQPLRTKWETIKQTVV